jgi:nucleotide-binding universal stress UspA family protein
MATKLDYRQILVATDFSPAAQAALKQALWIARESGAAITLVHVLPDLRRGMHSASIDAKLDLLYGEGTHFYQELRGDAGQRLRRSIDEAGAEGVDVHPKMLSGEPIVEICRAALQLESDLVIAGTLGAGGWQSLFVGSTARRLIRKCPSPVWVVKPQHSGKPKSILATTDCSEVSRGAVLAGMALANAAAATLHVLHVIDSNDVPENVVAAIPAGSSLRQEINAAAKDRFENFLKSLDGHVARIQPHLSWGTPWKEINRLATELNVDLITMGTVGRSGIRGLFLGNTAEKVLNSCDCSMLTFKPAGFQSPIPLTD